MEDLRSFDIGNFIWSALFRKFGISELVFGVQVLDAERFGKMEGWVWALFKPMIFPPPLSLTTQGVDMV